MNELPEFFLIDRWSDVEDDRAEWIAQGIVNLNRLDAGVYAEQTVSH